MKIAVIYQSYYGYTETYAKWLAEDLKADLLRADRVKPVDLQGYKTVIYGGGLYVGNVNGIALLAKNSDCFNDKDLYLFTVGMSNVADPQNIETVRSTIKQKLPPRLWERAHIYHFPGGMNRDKMGFVHRMMIGMLVKMLRKKPENALGPNEKALIAGKADFIDRKALAPLLAELRA